MQPVAVAHAALGGLYCLGYVSSWAALVIYLTRALELAALNYHRRNTLISPVQRHLILTLIQKYCAHTDHLGYPVFVRVTSSGDLVRLSDDVPDVR